ncbi:GxxExxY protein [Patescibacteria group bacterium]|nr:GxxExxY protein [Patescibacteria group bacterium]MBU0879742.1 GxxExxY protein [Patescibacteria group bacterium]MBU0880213.1 GxxExxY protein [Patescibacteria group bacterium]MBU0897674.1 GxxExxY protein [Patescibacteria group bacterium]MBU1783018.1 GxxExxY protein [Patescibacteria group bacterium]
MDYVDYKYYKSDITGKIIGCAQKVHCFLGAGFQEVIYQRALEIEFKELGLEFEREKEMLIFYKELEIGKRRVDFLVEDDIMVELKALTQLESVHITQLINYIEAYKVKVGLLINFGAKKLEVKRFIK